MEHGYTSSQDRRSELGSCFPSSTPDIERLVRFVAPRHSLNPARQSLATVASTHPRRVSRKSADEGARFGDARRRAGVAPPSVPREPRRLSGARPRWGRLWRRWALRIAGPSASSKGDLSVAPLPTHDQKRLHRRSRGPHRESTEKEDVC